MSKLPLAVDIADTVTKAIETDGPIDFKATSSQLREAHPESDTTSEEICDVLHEVSRGAGIADEETVPPAPV